MPNNGYGILDQKAPELNVTYWIDKEGKETTPIKLENYKQKFKVLFCFQDWCPGCHSQGFPSLKKMVDALEGNSQVVFFVIQTVFEGHQKNTADAIRKNQQKYHLKIPFGHDPNSAFTKGTSDTMYHYRSGGTPWFVFINEKDQVVFNDYHLDPDKAIAFFKIHYSAEGK